jgi:hypothetical protein
MLANFWFRTSCYLRFKLFEASDTLKARLRVFKNTVSEQGIKTAVNNCSCHSAYPSYHFTSVSNEELDTSAEVG